jgi:hypothetical protein
MIANKASRTEFRGLECQMLLGLAEPTRTVWNGPVTVMTYEVGSNETNVLLLLSVFCAQYSISRECSFKLAPKVIQIGVEFISGKK